MPKQRGNGWIDDVIIKAIPHLPPAIIENYEKIFNSEQSDDTKLESIRELQVFNYLVTRGFKFVCREYQQIDWLVKKDEIEVAVEVFAPHYAKGREELKKNKKTHEIEIGGKIYKCETSSAHMLDKKSIFKKICSKANNKKSDKPLILAIYPDFETIDYNDVCEISKDVLDSVKHIIAILVKTSGTDFYWASKDNIPVL